MSAREVFGGPLPTVITPASTKRPGSRSSGGSRSRSRSRRPTESRASHVTSSTAGGGVRGPSKPPRDTYVASLFDEPPPESSGGEPKFIPAKSGRVKVAVRCRPPFGVELEPPEGGVVVDVEPGRGADKVALNVDAQAKRREFWFDKAFPPTATQEDVYNEVGGPIVQNVLSGYNGTVLAYGQTGTGKTYTMGILNRVQDEHAGLIPRSLSHIFGHVEANSGGCEWTVSMSFLQIYLETVQDLFGMPSSGPGPDWDGRHREAGDENLQVREDPSRGFFVDGLQEYKVKDFEEAVELLNWGLENRRMGKTAMNFTSSRSHTVLTVNAAGMAYNRTLRGKLILVDLAGSERVVRAAGRQARLVEARSINASLSALGNVIVALSDPKASHVPYRDSKLTRLLQDSLSGGANTYLLATIGPAASSEAETLSTLQFASRCMRVESNPVVNEEVDYADLCVRLQSRLAGLESEFAFRQSEMAERYEQELLALRTRAEEMAEKAESPRPPPPPPAQPPTGAATSESEAPVVVTPVEGESGGAGDSGSVNAVVKYLYGLLCSLYASSTEPIRANMDREAGSKQAWTDRVKSAKDAEDAAKAEAGALGALDPKPALLRPDGEAQLPPVDRSQALTRVHSKFRSNNLTLPGFEPEGEDLRSVASSSRSLAPGADQAPGMFYPFVSSPIVQHPPVESFPDPRTFMAYAKQLSINVQSNVKYLSKLLVLKDQHFNAAKEDLAHSLMEARQLKDSLQAQSYALRDLVTSKVRLQRDLKAEKELRESVAAGVDRASSVKSPMLQRILRRNEEDAVLKASAAVTSSDDATLRKLEARKASKMVEANLSEADAAAIDLMTSAREAPHHPHRKTPSSGGEGLGEAAAASPLAETPFLDEIEFIVERRARNGRSLYKVHWKGSSATEDEWFDREDLLLDYPHLVKEYDERVG